MAARTRKVQLDQRHKDSIRASQLENRLVDHGLGKLDLSGSQVKALEVVLRKYKPDLKAVEVKGGDSPLEIRTISIPIKRAENK